MTKKTVHGVPVVKQDYNSVWGLIDNTLVHLKLQEPLEKHVEGVSKERSAIDFKYSGRRQAWVTAVLEMIERRADEWIATRYGVYCEVWKLQGYVISADFLRTLRDNIVEPSVHARTSGEVDNFIRMWERCGFPARQVLDSKLAAFRLTMQRLEHRWKTRLEIEANELEHQRRTLADEQRPESIVNKPKPMPPESQAVNRSGQAPDSIKGSLRYRSPVKRAIAFQFINNPSASDLEICRSLDADGAIELPRTWATGKNRLFEAAYKNSAVRRRIEITISKLRTALRAEGL